MYRFPFRFTGPSGRPGIKRPTTPRNKARLQVEALEERLVLNNRFVVPAGVPADNVTTFGSLYGALTTAGLSANNSIQIEPGATPGNVTAADLAAPNVPNLTLQGDPADSLTAIPMFTVSDQAVLHSAMSGFTLKNVNVGLIAAGDLQFFTQGAITGSSVVDINSTAGLAVFFNAFAVNNVANTVTNSTFTNVGGGNTVLLRIVPGTGTGDSNVISNNTFVASSPGGSGYLLEYYYPNGPTLTAGSDQVVNNLFLGNAGSNLLAMIHDAAPASGLTIRGNTFSDPDPNVMAIDLNNTGNANQQLTYVLGNTLRMTGANAIGLRVTGGASGGTDALFLQSNQITTDPGSNSFGLLIASGTTPTTSVYVNVQGNQFNAGKYGVQVNVSATPGNLTVDLGGGPGGLFPASLGDNNFRALGNATATGGPIVVAGANPAAAVTVNAQHNLFVGINPNLGVQGPIYFVQAGLSNVTVNAASQLTGNAAFVATLYNDFLKRAGDTTNAQDAGYWVNQIASNAMTPAQVANAILHSDEGLGVVVDGLYQKLLGRAADQAGRNFYINLIKAGTVEQAVTSLVTSPEYASLVGSDSGFVQSLYTKLLGRTGSNAEVGYWIGQVQMVGRAGVAQGLLASAEFRGDVVQELYGFAQPPAVSAANLFLPLLHRTAAPLAGDVNFFVNGNLDLLAIETAFAQTVEFLANG